MFQTTNQYLCHGCVCQCQPSPQRTVALEGLTSKVLDFAVSVAYIPYFRWLKQ